MVEHTKAKIDEALGTDLGGEPLYLASQNEKGSKMAPLGVDEASGRCRVAQGQAPSRYQGALPRAACCCGAQFALERAEAMLDEVLGIDLGGKVLPSWLGCRMRGRQTHGTLLTIGARCCCPSCPPQFDSPTTI